MIKQKYQFINYNGLRTKRLEELTSGFTKNLFDNAVVVIEPLCIKTTAIGVF
jgi:hypothetical protein